MAPKLLSPDVLEECLTMVAKDGGLPTTANELRAHIAALEADSAALVVWIDEWGHATWCEREHDKSLRCTEQCNAGPLLGPHHPGATLLAEHAKALVRARNEGLEKAAERLDVERRCGAACAMVVAHCADCIRAMKEDEP